MHDPRMHALEIASSVLGARSVPGTSNVGDVPRMSRVRASSEPVTLRLRSMRALSFGVLSIAATLTGSACERSTPATPAPSWPAGTVLALNGRPITAAEVDRVGSGFALMEPNDSLAQLRRLALTNVIIPRIAAADANPERRSEMGALAESYRAALVAGTMPPGPLAGPMEEERKGRLFALGLEVWNFALDAEIDRWSPVLETVGAYEIARVKKRMPGPSPGWTEFTVGVFDFPYVDGPDPRRAIDEAIDRSRLVFVDDSWREVVPAAWIYRLHAGTP
jgi:hypothetical protein